MLLEGQMQLPGIAALILAIALPVALGFVGALTSDGGDSDWYKQLNKPPWTPPNWAFPVVWTILYVLMGVASWLIWLHGGFERQSIPLAVYFFQLLLNFMWTPIFFGLHRPEEHRRESAFSQRNRGSDQALSARGRGKRGGSGGRGRGRFPSRGCGSGGRASNSSRHGEWRSQSASGKKTGDCHYCGKPGHWKKDCWKWKADQERSNGGNDKKQQGNYAGKKKQIEDGPCICGNYRSLVGYCSDSISFLACKLPGCIFTGALHSVGLLSFNYQPLHLGALYYSQQS